MATPVVPGETPTLPQLADRVGSVRAGAVLVEPQVLHKPPARGAGLLPRAAPVEAVRQRRRAAQADRLSVPQAKVDQMAGWAVGTVGQAFCAEDSESLAVQAVCQQPKAELVEVRLPPLPLAMVVKDVCLAVPVATQVLPKPQGRAPMPW
jgi:hypothetical protein